MNYLRDLKDNFSFILNKNGMPSFIYQPKIVVKKFKQNRKEIEDYFTREYAKNFETISTLIFLAFKNWNALAKVDKKAES